jgi:aldehyde dehydrogenase (NAD+)
MDKKTYNIKINRAVDAQTLWRNCPAPRRGELVRIFGNKLREHLQQLGELVTKDSKKIIVEGIGEVQEAIDMCDFAVGLSRQLYGKTMPSERQNHKLQEVWHPLGVVGVISAFNFPCAVWAWNHILAIVCGNSVVWKPSPRSMNITNRLKELWDESVEEFLKNNIVKHTMGDRFNMKDLLQVVEGHITEAEWLADDTRINLLSATGSTNMGKSLAPRVSARLGKLILELGGNNAMIVSQHANIDLAVRAAVFSAVGTCGQRCTTLRRLIVNNLVYDDVLEKIKKAYKSLPIGDPMDQKNLVGPLIDKEAVATMQQVLEGCREEGHIVHGGDIINDCYVRPAIVEVKEQDKFVHVETFAPILYVMKYLTVDNAIRKHNIVKQGLSSCIFTDNLQEAEQFTSAVGSDAGIVNVNIGTSGAEIGGAFGGEKDTGGGRESGSDAWKQYMRRTTITTNWSKELPLAQGIKFDLE